MDPSLTVVLVDANLTLRKGTELLLRSWGHHVIGRADDADRGYELIGRSSPNVALVDGELPAGAAAELAGRAAESHPATGVVLQLGHPNPLQLDQAMSCGAAGLALKCDEADELRAVIEAIGDGDTHLTPALRRLASAREADTRILSVREREVLQLLAHGATGEQASRLLTVSPQTVRTHVRNAMRKLRTSTRVHAVTTAVARHEIQL
ncbi:MAG TPA: response regulator transcription factor [Thermoleophilaceae bacterium]|jgi:DNA-binding NarL/FixJ family response regulator